MRSPAAALSLVLALVLAMPPARAHAEEASAVLKRLADLEASLAVLQTETARLRTELAAERASHEAPEASANEQPSDADDSSRGVHLGGYGSVLFESMLQNKT